MAPTQSTETNTILEIKNLKTYFFLDSGTFKAVNGVHLSLDRNTTLGIVGESGSGKSVTSFSLMRLIQTPPGKIVDGQMLYHQKDGEIVDLAKLDRRGPKMRSIRGGEIAMIFQEPMTSLNPLYTIGAQIAETVKLHQNMHKKDALDRALEMLYKVNISDPKQRLDQYPHQLSGGMRQRVMIAMALSCNPSLLIADEPTTALDVTIQAQILDLMANLKDEFNAAIVLITHDLGVVAETAARVVVMYAGKIVEEADVYNIFEHPLHPYTVGLLESIPRLDSGADKQERLREITGMVPIPSQLPSGCLFHPRCPKVMNVCRHELPDLKFAQPEHKVRCWLYE
jgi:oligopeptide/dipeptide ABC transporter ATP-binding protein